MDFRATFTNSIAPAVAELDQFPWADKVAYANFLAQTYYYIRHSTKLLTLASSRFGFEEHDLHRRFIQHAAEEAGHEALCTKDLQLLGFKAEQFRELPSTQAFYQRQYYLIERVDPICFMGYIFCLEGMATSCCAPIMKIVAEKLSDKAILFLRVHAADDVEHIEKALEAVEKLPASRLALVEANLDASARLYRDMVKEAAVAAPALLRGAGVSAA